MKYVFQIFTGDLSEKSLADPKMLLEKLAPFHLQGKLQGVLCGWSLDKEFYRTLGKQLKEWKVPMYFKTAVFSEWVPIERIYPGFTFDRMVDFEGKEMEPYHLNPEESFWFRCPSSTKNREIILKLYEEQMEELGFDGIFLDRIRYSSLLGGISGVGGCFCERCRKIYEEKGLDTERIQRKLKKAAEEKKLPLKSYRSGRWELSDPDLESFFKARAEILLGSVDWFAEKFHAKGMKIGLDLFSPAFGYFAGQELLSLCEKVDFIKPMLYRYTFAPAGIPFEAKALRKAVGEEAYGVFLKECGSMEKDAEAFVLKELDVLKESACPVYAGMEVNTVEPIVDITPERVREEKRILTEKGIETMVPSWNLAKMKEECLEALLQD